MNWFYNTVAAVKNHGNAWSARINIFGFVATIVLFFIFKDGLCLCAALGFLLFLMWDFNDSLNKELRAELTRLLTDKCDEVVTLKGELVKKDDEIEILKATTSVRKDNPIKSNRIVSDKTFALRLRNFAESTQVNDPAGADELEYFKNIAERLLKWQTKTVRKDSEEYKYLERLGLMPQPSANAEEHTEEVAKPKPQKPKAKAVRKPKNTETEKTGNENQDR